MCDVGKPRSARSAATAAEVADADSGCSSDAANAKVSEPVSRSSATSAWGTCADSLRNDDVDRSGAALSSSRP